MARKLARVTLNVLAVVSLLLCAGVCVLWARSYGRYEWVQRRTGRGDWMVGSTSGRLVLIRHPQAQWGSHQGWMTHSETRGVAWSFEDVVGQTFLGDDGEQAVLGFQAGRDTLMLGNGSPVEWLIVPLWAVALPLALPPCWHGFALLRRGRRVHAGHCPACGYDLRARPGRCPECGQAPRRG